MELKYADVATPILMIIVVGKNLHSYFDKYRSSASYMEIPEQVQVVPSLCKDSKLEMTIPELDMNGCNQFIDAFLNIDTQCA